MNMIMRPLALFFGCVAASAFLFGCANKEPVQDPFFEKWKIMADQAQGHSPAPRERSLELDETAVDQRFARQPFQEEKQLPTRRISLKMHEADIVAVLQAMARAADQSILIKSGVQGQVNISVENKPWNQVFEAILKTNGLSYAWEGDLIRVMGLEDMKNTLEIQDVQKRFQNVEPMVSHIVKIHYADARNLRENLVTFLSKGQDGAARGSVVVDAHTNSLIIQGIESDIQNMIRMINRLDHPRAQIKLKAHIVETTSEVARNLGVQWGGILQADSAGSNSLWVTPGSSTPFDVSGGNFGVNLPADTIRGTDPAKLGLLFGTIGGDILELQLSALQDRNKLRILSSPSITTLDNQTAFTENGERVPFVATGEDGEIEVKFEDAVLRLEITPHIIDGENLKMEILVKKDEVDTTRNVLGNPFIIKKQTQTTLITRTGETVVISGLTKQRNNDGESGVPGLMDVPGLGRLFKTTGRANELEDVLIFITPHILPQWQQGERQLSMQEVEDQMARQEAESKDTPAQ